MIYLFKFSKKLVNLLILFIFVMAEPYRKTNKKTSLG